MKLSAIKPNPDNPRLIKDEKFKKLVQSINDRMLKLDPTLEIKRNGEKYINCEKTVKNG